MKYNEHRYYEGTHAIFSASRPYWLNYDDDRVIDFYRNAQAKTRGTKLHAWAKSTIDLGIKQKGNNSTLSMYVNDAIGYKMDTEILLFYSKRFFGTADAICFRNNILRIHDLKTGVTEADINQLIVYAALFCLEYEISPKRIKIELRIYQNNDIVVCKPEPEDVMDVMSRIKYLDALIEKSEGGVL